MSVKTSPDQAAAGRATRRIWSNKTASLLISIGGVGVIAVVIAIFVFIGYETIPLWLSPEAVPLATLNPGESDGEILAVGENEYRTAGFAVLRNGVINFFDPKSGTSLNSEKIIPENQSLELARIDPSQKNILLVNSQNSASIKSISIGYTETDNQFSSAQIGDLTEFSAGPLRPRAIDFNSEGPDEFSVISASESGVVRFFRIEPSSGLFGGSTLEVQDTNLGWDYDGDVTSVAIDRYGEKGMVATSTGWAYYWDLRDEQNLRMSQSIRLSPTGVSAMAFLLGGQTLVVGDESGRVSTWTWVLDAASASGIGMIPLNEFSSHSGAVTSIASANRNKSFLTGSSTGEVFLHYQTTGKTLLKRKPGSSPILQVSFSPRADGILTLASDGLIASDSLFNPHPEISLSILFGKVQYEGYRNPSFTWQSTGGTDDFESKFSLVPLLTGTIKGAVYALIFALPMAIFGALYTALFAHPKVRNIIKPIVELMAALPSVVIGFIAALWLAPILEKRFVDVALVVVTFPLSVFAALLIWGILPKKLTNRFLFGSEIVVILPALMGIMYMSSLAAPFVESFLFDGSFRHWLYESMEVTYDQRNSIVVGFAMGFAVIPIIFTISEDALSSVPEHLAAGSLALGATRWQTATRVVLPTASPGIFSATMIGFGRAVGETMIVLMATGNTPVMDFSAFLGMRTLSANIAVEIPEAPYLGTLYRILFFSGLLLFIFTFVVNTVAELIRLRLRKRYSTI